MTAPPSASPPTLGYQAVTAVLWTAGQKWVARIGGFVTIAILARLLSPTEFGTVAAATAVLPVAYLLADMGFSTYVVQARDISVRLLSTAFWFSVMAGLALAAGLLLAAPVFAAIFHTSEATDVVRALAPLVMLVSISSVSMALMRRRMQFRALAVQSLIASVAGQVCAIVMAFNGFGVWSLVSQMFVFQLITTIYACGAARWLPRLQFSVPEFRRMAAFGMKVVGVDLVGVLRQWAEYAIISAFLGTAGLGYLNVAQRLVQIAQDVTAAAVLPVTTVVFARIRTEPERLRSGYRRALGMTYSITIPVMIFLTVSAPQLVPFLFGAQWADSIAVAQVLGCVGILTMVAMLDHGLFYGAGRPGTWFIFAVIVDAATIVVALFTAPHGLVVWALGFLGVAVASTLVRQPLVGKLLGMRWGTIGAVSARALLCALVAGAVGVALGFATASLWPAVSIAAIGVGVVLGHLGGMRLFLRPELHDIIRLAQSRLGRFGGQRRTANEGAQT